MSKEQRKTGETKVKKAWEEGYKEMKRNGPGKRESARRRRQKQRVSERASERSGAPLTPCKALFRNNETSPESNISKCHILSVSMVLVFPARL